MNERVLVIAEKRQDRLKNVTQEALTVARKITDSDISAGIIGETNKAMIEQLKEYGAESIYRISDRNLNITNPDVVFQALLKMIRTADPDVVIIGHSLIGKEIAPRLASRLGMALVSDVTEAEIDEGDIVYTRPVYSGKAYETITSLSKKVIVTLRPNNVKSLPASRASEVKVIELPVEMSDIRIHVRHSIEKNTNAIDLSEAKIVVAGGRGVQSAEGFKLLRTLADCLGGAVGASRAACDAGYCDYALQIGQTGKTVTPDLYIACGISGAIQHLAGMSHAKRIIAINKDPEAPIFDVADYGFVGDLFEMIPKLIDRLTKPTIV